MDADYLRGGFAGAATSQLSSLAADNIDTADHATGAADGIAIRIHDEEIQAHANLYASPTELARRQIPVPLVGMRAPPNFGPDYALSFEALFPVLARKHRGPLYRFVLDGVVATRSLIQPAGLRPHARGVRIIADRIAPVARASLRATRASAAPRSSSMCPAERRPWTPSRTGIASCSTA